MLQCARLVHLCKPLMVPIIMKVTSVAGVLIVDFPEYLIHVGHWGVAFGCVASGLAAPLKNVK